MKKTVLILILTVILMSSCAKRPSIEQMLDSNDPAAVKSALADMWRLDDQAGMTRAIELLSKPEFAADAAEALAMMRSDIIDKVVENRMSGAQDTAGHYLYFLMRCRAKNYNVPEAIPIIDKPAPVTGIAADFIRAMLAGDYRQAELQFNAAAGIRAAQKEFILLAGNKQIAESYDFLQYIRDKDRELSPLAAWAMNMIRSGYKIKYDLVDRTITENPYWQKQGDGPVMPAIAGTFKSWHTANPDILVENGMVYFYYRGGDGRDRMAVASVPYETFDGVNFTDYPNNPILNLGKKAFDDGGILDPGTVYFNKKVFLYYSGLGTGDDAVGLAVSKDFYNFKKYSKNPVITGRAPEVVLKDGLLYLYYVKPNEYGGYSIYLATSRDGYNFAQYGSAPVFSYGVSREWDSKSVTVPRIVEKDGMYYMFYAGDDKYMDYPAFFGVAFSYDLVNWYRGTQNPVFSRGKKGGWDDGGIWYAEVFPYKNRLYMYYEGWGGGESHDKEYGPGGHSQIGLCRILRWKICFKQND